VFVQRTGIRAPTDHKSKYKQEIDFGEKNVGRGRVERPGRKTKRKLSNFGKAFIIKEAK
jgi:hypothetical protein